MKKVKATIISILLVISILIIFVGCNQTPADIPNDINLLSMEDKEAIYDGTYGTKENEPSSSTYYGVGRSLNVITDEYITVSAGYSKVFDADKLLDLNWRKTFAGKMNSNSKFGSSMSDFYLNISAEYKNSFGAGVDFNVFSAGVKSQFQFAAGVNYQSVANEIYFTASQVYANTLIEIDEYYNLNQFEKILSKNFLQDVESVQTGKMTAKSFIYKYGTHVVLAGYYGGRLDCFYYLGSWGEQWDSNAQMSYQNKIGLEIEQILSFKNESGFSLTGKLGNESKYSEERFMASAIGGANFGALTMTEFLNNYSAWTDSMNGQNEYGNMVDLPNRSLAAIWDLLPGEYAIAKQIIRNEFVKEAASTSENFINQYKRNYIAPDNNNTTEFDGGSGTAANPYIISNKQHFENIQNDPTKYFKLYNSINLGIWNSPFEFSGNLDGNGHEITYVQTLGTDKVVYGGLFTQLNGASINDLLINATISSPIKDNTLYVGGLAGSTKGLVTISKVSTSGEITIKDGKGADYIGGIIGQFLGGDIEQCRNSIDIEDHAYTSRTGGIVGYATPSEITINISNCFNVGSMKACTGYIWGGRSAGGIVGQVRGHDVFKLNINCCYNDSDVKIVQTKNAALGWWGCGGIFGDIGDKKSTNMSVSNSYWNKNKASLAGNNNNFHKNNAKTNMNGTYSGWSTEIWRFSSSKAPELIWLADK
ncbi:MAG: hypothetical protein J1G02_01570 [Clostridiales bacterium]|nr:hypothetical protein [Clostridiales bacterium]